MNEKSPSNITQPSQFALFRERRFLPLFITQFLGAFNDNAYKNSLVVLLTFSATSWTSMKPELLANVAAGLFILPFFLFSATAGQLADKFDKARLARLAKLLEISIILIAALGFWLESLPVLLAALFLLGLQSTLFGPVKYAILPQHLRPEELIGGNALIEGGTFVSILLGTLTGGLLASFHGGMVWIVVICLFMAVGGYLASLKIPFAPAPAPELKISFNPLSESWRVFNYAREKRSVFLSILGISWFWAYGAILLAQFPIYTKNILRGDETLVTVLIAIFSVSVGVGSLLCERLTRRRGKAVEPGLVPIGALGIVVFGIDFSLVSPTEMIGAALPLSEAIRHGNVLRVLMDLAMMGIFGGIYCVPLYAMVQQRSSAKYRARIIAANNILNALFMVLAALGASFFLSLGFRIPNLFLMVAGIHAIVTIYIFTLAPEFLIRALVWLGWKKE